MIVKKTLSVLKSLHAPYLLLGALAGFVLLRTPMAFAGQSEGPVSPSFAGMSQAAWNWFTCATGVIAYAAQWVDPSNASTPGSWTGKTRMIAFTVLGVVAGLAHFVAKDPSIPWTESVVVGFGTVVVPALLHFAPLLSAKGRESAKMMSSAGGAK